MNVGIHEAAINLSALIDRAEAGDEVIIEKDTHHAVKLVPVYQANYLDRQPGSLHGKIKPSDDFNEFGPELQEMFGMKES